LFIFAGVLSGKDLLGELSHEIAHIEQLSFPSADLVRVYPKALGQGGDRVAPFEGFEGDFGFEFGGVLFSY